MFATFTDWSMDNPEEGVKTDVSPTREDEL